MLVRAMRVSELVIVRVSVAVRVGVSAAALPERRRASWRLARWDSAFQCSVHVGACGCVRARVCVCVPSGWPACASKPMC